MAMGTVETSMAVTCSVTCGVALSVLINVASVKRAVRRCEDGLERIERRLADSDRRPPVLDYIATEAAPVAPSNTIPVDAEVKAWYDSLATNPSAIPPPRVQKVLRENLAESVREYRRFEQEVRK